MSGQGYHNYERPVRTSSGDDEEEDPLETMLNRTGCKELHYSLQVCIHECHPLDPMPKTHASIPLITQDCMAEHRDWRRCQDLVQKFKDCMIAYEKTKAHHKNNSDK
ncbi:unnamed protein product [Oppiella nova]|uniref:Uncharacterized protein n=1 Tax=Oppiella nova TaxID=334625 RepID=A0A7R9LX01_9ACAR|nr:unnamed protein product [Oppiella nova]CAG2167715.1 unnamed protein product [Oppiella nova]